MQSRGCALSLGASWSLKPPLPNVPETSDSLTAPPPEPAISTMSRSWVALAAQLLLASSSVLRAKNGRLALSTSWGCLRCMHLALHGGLPRDLTSLALEAGVLLGCLGCLHCMQRLL